MHGVLAMSRIGKHPVPVPSCVEASVSGQTVKVKGKLGEMNFDVHPEIVVALNDNAITVEPRNEGKVARAMWGMSRTRIANMVDGVTKGFTRELAISGVGYRAAAAGNYLTLQLGFSHDIIVAVPEDLQVKCPSPTQIVISGYDKQRVGQLAAEVRGFRPPEPYKGKGIRYSDEQILRKEGKKK